MRLCARFFWGPRARVLQLETFKRTLMAQLQDEGDDTTSTVRAASERTDAVPGALVLHASQRFIDSTVLQSMALISLPYQSLLAHVCACACLCLLYLSTALGVIPPLSLLCWQVSASSAKGTAAGGTVIQIRVF